MLRVFALGLLLRLRHIDEVEDRKLVGPQRVAVMRAALAQFLVQFLGAHLGHEHGGVAEAELGGDLDGLGTAGADDVAGRMRPLIGRGHGLRKR